MIAVDVMGGDFGPGEIIKGAVLAADSIPVMLLGPEEIIVAELEKINPCWQANKNIFVHNSSQFVEMHEEPLSAIIKKKQASMVHALQLVKEGRCFAAISAGNSGAFMAASLFELGRNENIARPAIAGFLPALNGRYLALDLGANTDCRAEHLYQFAHIGAEYLEKTLKFTNPKIGLLSNGQEDSKGSKLTKETFLLLKNSQLNFQGNVEPYDLFDNKVDVVVCDGFSGNVLLKTTEAACEMMMNFAKRNESIDSIGKKIYCSVGGAMLLGVNGNVIVCHGSAKSSDIENAVKFAWDVTNCK